MSISQNFPDISPSLNLNFAGARKLDSRITFTRGSTGTYMDENGLIKTAGINQARFDHSYDGSDITSLGLLVEESRTNFLTYSEDTSQYNFLDQATVSTNQIVSPDGATTADKLTSDINGGSNNCFVQKSFSVSADTSTYVMSVFLKAGTSPQSLINLQLAGGTYQQSTATINWSSNTITQSSGGTATLNAYPNGWYRVSLTLTNNGTNTACSPRVYVRGQGTDNVSGEYVYIWGWQTESGSFPTSYIPTGASAATRSADNASITGTNFSSWYNSTEGTLFAAARVNALGGGTYPGITYVDDGTPNNSLGFYIADAVGDYIGAESYVSGSAQYGIVTSPTPITANQLTKVITAYKANDFAAAFSITSTVGTDNSGSVSTVNRLIIGDLRGNSAKLNGTISQLFYYPKRLTNTQLQNLTK